MTQKGRKNTQIEIRNKLENKKKQRKDWEKTKIAKTQELNRTVPHRSSSERKTLNYS